MLLSNHSHTSHRRRAFSLLELAIVLIVVGLMTGVALSLKQSTDGGDCYAETKAQLTDVDGAIQRFARQNERLPMPASRSVGVEGITYGREASGAAIDTAGGTSWGALPFQALGLAPSYASDCWGNKLTYVVTTALTVSAGGYLDYAVLGNITVKKDAATTSTSIAGYAVISHGEDALGAVKNNYAAGSHGWCSGAATLANQNCLASAPTVANAVFNNGKDAGAAYFDDIVITGGRMLSVNGACNTSAPGGACVTGTVSGDNGLTACGTTRTWNCDGANGGTNAACSYTNPACGVACVAGPANALSPQCPTGYRYASVGTGGHACVADAGYGIYVPDSIGNPVTVDFSGFDCPAAGGYGSPVDVSTGSATITQCTRICTGGPTGCAASSVGWGGIMTFCGVCGPIGGLPVCPVAAGQVCSNLFQMCGPGSPGNSICAGPSLCAGNVGALAEGASTSVANTAGGYAGSVTVTCTAGSIVQSAPACSVAPPMVPAAAVNFGDTTNGCLHSIPSLAPGTPYTIESVIYTRNPGLPTEVRYKYTETFPGWSDNGTTWNAEYPDNMGTVYVSGDISQMPTAITLSDLCLNNQSGGTWETIVNKATGLYTIVHHN